MSGEFSRESPNGDTTAASNPLATTTTTTANGSAPDAHSPIITKPGSNDGPSQNGPGASRAVEDVMYSNIGINTLLNRLKQSIASARDFAQFLKKRSALEEEQAKGLKRLAQSQLENVKRGEVRGGSYAQQLTEMLRVHERMADNGMQFALSLHQMHEDLDVLSANMERGRKQWKHEGLDAEKRASDAESMMQKAKSKYDALAEDYDRARTGDNKGSRRLGLKGPKSAEQHESDLLRKTEVADSDYKLKVEQARTSRELLLREGRPKAVRAIQELVNECDSALTLQLQKFATFNEKLLLGNGLVVSPLTGGDVPVAQRGLRDLVVDIDNERDFHSFIASHKVPPRPSEIRYEQHPTLAPKTQVPRQPPTLAPPSTAPTMQPSLVVNTGNAASTSQQSSTTSRYGAQPSSQLQSFNGHSSSSGYEGNPPSGTPQDLFHQSSSPSYNPQTTPLRDTYNPPPYPTHKPERATPGISPAHQQTIGSIGPAGATTATMASPIYQPSSKPATGTRRVFGVSLDDLFAQDQSAVPLIVFQSIQAIDLYGLDTEGIYRHSGSHATVNRLREAWDTLPPSSGQLDFRNPSNFVHDVNAVTSLLKQFFRDLPDPLFTKAGYDDFLQAARSDDEAVRRDGLHQCINDLPDPNYATLRALVLHLGRIMQNESRTRMTAENLAVCLAPTLMGAHNGAIADASWQQRVVATILANANAIFDED